MENYIYPFTPKTGKEFFEQAEREYGAFVPSIYHAFAKPAKPDEQDEQWAGVLHREFEKVKRRENESKPLTEVPGLEVMQAIEDRLSSLAERISTLEEDRETSWDLIQEQLADLEAKVVTGVQVTGGELKLVFGRAKIPAE